MRQLTDHVVNPVNDKILPIYRRIIRKEMLMAQMERAGLIVRHERKQRRRAKAGKGARRG